MLPTRTRSRGVAAVHALAYHTVCPSLSFPIRHAPLEPFVECLKTAIQGLVRAHDDDDASVRVLASECLNVVIKVGLLPARVSVHLAA